MGLKLKTYKKKCKTTLGGVKNTYLLLYEEYTRAQVKDSKMLLTAFPESYLYKFECIGNYSQNSEVEDGAVYFNQSVNIELSEVYNELDINAFINNDFRVVVETNNNDFLMFGAYNGMECKATNSSGSSKSEFNGFVLDFKGKEKKTALKIESLEDLGLTIVGSGTVFNFIFQDGNNFSFQDNNNYNF